MYYIPSLRINIISLGKLAKEIFKVIMHGIFFFWVYGSKNELLIKVKIGSYRIYKNLVKTVKPMYLLSKSLIKNGFSISTLVMLTFNQLNSWMTKTWLLICQVLFHQIKYMRFLWSINMIVHHFPHIKTLEPKEFYNLCMMTSTVPFINK